MSEEYLDKFDRLQADDNSTNCETDSHYTKPKADVNKEKQKLTIICSKFQLKAKELEAESLMMLLTPNKSKLQLTNQT